jgi:DNA-binding NtrC family response regulator
MSIFTNSRYSELQTLAAQDHTLLLRGFDAERGEQVLMRVFRTSREAEQSYILTEIASLAKLAAPQLATIYDIGLTAANEPYMVFEQMPHIPLENVPPAQFHIPEFIAAVAVSALQALAPLHQQYRALACLSPRSLRLEDIEKPSVRIALDTWEPSYNPDVMRAFYGAHNRYAAPEFAAGLVLDGRADVFALGVTLYEAVTGLSFAELSMVDAPGMISHLVVKNLRDHAPTLPDALGQWLYGLLERDRAMRFFSAREALDYLVAHGLAKADVLTDIEHSPVNIAPVNAIGLESAFAAVVNVQSPYAESAVLEISGEPGVGKTFLLSTLMQSRLQSTALLRQKIEYVRPHEAAQLADRICNALEHQEPTLFLVDDAELISEKVRTAAKEALAREGTLLVGVRVVATHRSQLPLLAAKPTMVTLSHLAPSHLPLFCSEVLGRCAFTPDFTKHLYSLSKGHPLFLETLLRRMAQSGVITRRNRIWTHGDIPTTQADTTQTLHQSLMESIRALPEEMSTTLAALVALSKAGVQSVSLHLLAELLDASTQATMRLVLPLSFDGFLRLRSSYLEFAHDVVFEAALSACSEATIQALLLKWRLAGHTELHQAPQSFPPQKTDVVHSPASSQTPQIAATPVTTVRTEEKLVEVSQVEVLPVEVSPVEDPNVEIADVEKFENDVQQNTIENERLQMDDTSIDAPQAVILHGDSKQAQILRRNVEIAASHQHLACLLEGTFGAQKEELAFLIHSASERREAPFHAVSCSDFTGDELEAYLFGASGGTGLLYETQGGTVFLDDISAALPNVQIRLGRFVQAVQKQRGRAGSPSGVIAKSLQTQELPDARVIIGFTISDGVRSEAALRTGTFQPELFFAVSSVRVSAPLLDERREDIPALAREFARSIAREYGVNAHVQDIPLEFWQQLSRKEWLGDVSELEALMRRLVLTLSTALSAAPDSAGELAEELLSEELRQPANVFRLSQANIGQNISHSVLPNASVQAEAHTPQFTSDGLLSIDDAQKEHILRALKQTGGNKTKAAEMLKIKRTTLLARMKKFGLMP